MDGTIGKLREAMAEFDGYAATERGLRVRTASRVLTLVRQLLSEVEGGAELRRLGDAGHWHRVEPLGPPNPAHGELPE